MAGRAEGKAAARGAAGWRAWTARILSVAVLLASILVHPCSEAAAGDGLWPTAVAVAAAGADGGGGGAGTPLRPDATVHAGAHCVCHMADRLDPPEHAAPAVFAAVVHPDRTARALASRGAEPPARPPRV
ncbi:hypothetical protein GCM10009416_34500 [Craurococcus roseus]|uniref:DUF2946 domain-containing protein n=1 Tax=Craurococcus roseus TaxID=77585 RepID=A0ABN1FLB5_9PROT